MSIHNLLGLGMGVKFDIGEGGGSSGFEADLPGVRASASAVSELAGGLRGARTYGPLEGCGDYSEVATAVARVLGAWDPALTAWQSSLESLGSAASGAAQAIEDNDIANAAAIEHIAPGMPGALS